MTALTDELLAHRLAERAERAPAMSLAAIARSVAVEPRRRTPAAGRFAILAPLAAVFVLAVVVVGGLLSRSSPHPAASVSPGTSSTLGSNTPVSAPPSSPVTGPDTITAWSSLTWEKTSPLPFASDETMVTDAIALGDGFLAVGTTRGPGGIVTGHVWRSIDGRVWERIDVPRIEALLPRQIVTVGDSIVILGLEPATGDGHKNLEVWESIDGRIWTQGPTPPVPADPTPAAGGPAGILLLAGQDAWLLGPDLATWTKMTTWPDDVYLGTPAWAGGQWIQPGTTGVDVNGEPSQAAVWTSQDATTWDAAAVAKPAGGMFSVIGAADGMIGIGTADDVCLRCFGRALSSTAIWASSDGRSWNRIGLPADVFPRGPGLQFAGDGRRIVVIGHALGGSGTETTSMVSETFDGPTWTPIAATSARGPDPLAIYGRAAVGANGMAILPGNLIDRSSGAFVPQPWWGAATPAAAGAPTPSPSAAPSSPVTGCDTLGFDARRCAAVVAQARHHVGDPASVVAIVIRRTTFDPTSLGSQPLANVEFTFADGTTKTIEFRCLNLGSQSDLACSNDAQLSISNGVSHDVPCGATPGDEDHPCATIPPSPKPAVVAASTPLVLPVFDVPIDHVGHYEILVGSASLPDGLLSERSGELADSRPTAYWIDQGVGIIVRPGPPCIGVQCPEIDSIYRAPFHGPQPVHVYLVFDVTELDTPGAVLEVRNLVVR